MSSSSSEVPASYILRIPSPRRFVPGCGRHPQEWSRGKNPGNGRRRDFGRRRHLPSGFQYTYRPRTSSPELFNKDHNASRESLSHLNIELQINRSLLVSGIHHITSLWIVSVVSQLGSIHLFTSLCLFSRRC